MKKIFTFCPEGRRVFTMVRVEEVEAWGLGGAAQSFTRELDTNFEKVPLDHLNFLLSRFFKAGQLAVQSSCQVR